MVSVTKSNGWVFQAYGLAHESRPLNWNLEKKVGWVFQVNGLTHGSAIENFRKNSGWVPCIFSARNVYFANIVYFQGPYILPYIIIEIRTDEVVRKFLHPLLKTRTKLTVGWSLNTLWKIWTDLTVRGSLHPLFKIWPNRRSVNPCISIENLRPLRPPFIFASPFWNWTDSVVHGSLRPPLEIRTKSAVHRSLVPL